MAWTTPRTWVSTEVVTASIMNTHVRDNFNETAPAIVSAAGQYVIADAANSLVNRLPAVQGIVTSETTASASYTDLATSGPAVTQTCFSRALVIVSAQMSNDTGGETCFMSYALSGATAVSASDNRALMYESGAANDQIQHSFAEIRTGLTQGSNTFTAKYRVTGGTGTYLRRFISVLPF